MIPTFGDLSLPFKLFQAPVAHAVTDAEGICAICGDCAAVRFRGACYRCFRDALGKSVIDTEFGAVNKEFASKGITHGIPISDTGKYADHNLTPHTDLDPDADSDWYHFHFDVNDLNELIRTPSYHTWQGETWLFCCRRPMAFRGLIPADVLDPAGSDIASQIESFLAAPNWEITVPVNKFWHTYCTFSCKLCGKVRYHEDMD